MEVGEQAAAALADSIEMADRNEAARTTERVDRSSRRNFIPQLWGITWLANRTKNCGDLAQNLGVIGWDWCEVIICRKEPVMAILL